MRSTTYWRRAQRALFSSVVIMSTTVGIDVASADMDGDPPGTELRTTVYYDANDNHDPDPGSDPRIRFASVDYYLDGASTPTGSIRTTFSGIQPASEYDVLGTIPNGSTATVCANPISQYVNNNFATAVDDVDPEGEGRPCVLLSPPAGLRNMSANFVNSALPVEIRVASVEDLNDNNVPDYASEPRIRGSDFELYLDGALMPTSSVTANHTGVQPMSVYSVVGSVAVGTPYVVCETPPSDWVSNNPITSVTAPDPENLGRSCARGIPEAGYIYSLRKFVSVRADSPAVTSDLLVRTYNDVNDNSVADDGIDPRLSGVQVDYYLADGSFVDSVTTRPSGIQPFVAHDVLGSVEVGQDFVICATVPAGWASNDEPLLVDELDPLGLNRPCIFYRARHDSTPTAITFVFKPEPVVVVPTSEVRFIANIDVDGNTRGDSSEPRLAGVEVDYYVGGSNTPSTSLTTTFAGFQPATYDVLGSEPDGTTVTVCATAPMGYTINNSGSYIDDLDPEGLDRPCRTETTPVSDAVYVGFVYAAVDPAVVPGAVTIIKQVSGDDDSDLDFGFELTSSSLPGPVAFEISEDDEPVVTFQPARPGVYTITEDELDGWELQRVRCRGAEYEVALDGHKPVSVDIDIAAGEHATCTFYNRKLPTSATLTLSKRVDIDDADDVEFDFEFDGDPFSMRPSDDEYELTDLEIGTTYRVTELPRSGWELDRFFCEGLADAEPVFDDRDLVGVDITFNTPGHTSCQFDNIVIEPTPDPRFGSFTLRKVIADSDDDGRPFVFEIVGPGFIDAHIMTVSQSDGGEKGYSDGLAGTYTIIERTSVGWVMDGVECTNARPRLIYAEDGDTLTGFTVGLDEGAHVDCSVTNRFVPRPPPPALLPDLTITKTSSVMTADRSDAVSYIVTVTNTGDATAHDVVVVDTPNGVALLSTNGCNNDPTGTASCQLGSVAPGVSSSYTVNGRIDHDAGDVATNLVIVSTSTTESDTTNNSARASISIIDDAPTPPPPPPPPPVPTPTACPSGAITIGSHIGTYANPASPHVGVNLAPGKHNVKLYSSDSLHAPGYQTSQASERWVLEFFLDGTLVASSAAIADLPEDQTTLRQLVGDVELPHGATTVRARYQGPSSLNSVTADCAVVAIVDTPPPPPPLPRACDAGGIWINSLLLGGQSSGAVAVSLEAGSYDVRLGSRDNGHAAGYQSYQTAEMWRLDFYNASGALIASSGSTGDLAEAVKSTTYNVGQVVLSEAAASVRAVHAGGAVNSIDAVCAGATRLPDPEPEPEPTPAPDKEAELKDEDTEPEPEDTDTEPEDTDTDTEPEITKIKDVKLEVIEPEASTD